mgnify:CR=1 FL=1
MYCVIIMNTVDGTVDATVASVNIHKKEDGYMLIKFMKMEDVSR